MYLGIGIIDIVDIAISYKLGAYSDRIQPAAQAQVAGYSKHLHLQIFHYSVQGARRGLIITLYIVHDHLTRRNVCMYNVCNTI